MEIEVALVAVEPERQERGAAVAHERRGTAHLLGVARPEERRPDRAEHRAEPTEVLSEGQALG